MLHDADSLADIYQIVGKEAKWDSVPYRLE
jgi:hypothetical protein